MELLDSFRTWLRDIIQSFVLWILHLCQALLQWFEDMLLNIFEKLLAALRFVIEQIPMPDILQYSLQDLFGQIPPDVMYFLNQSGISQGLLFIAMGVSFRLVRKFATLFQW